MKQVIIILLALFLSAQGSYAQDTRKLGSFREKMLPQYNSYFDLADLAENGQLRLRAIDKYIALSVDEKKIIMESITAAWREPQLFVQYGSKTEMWGWDEQTGSTQLLDQWDMNHVPEAKTPGTKLNAHPWFIYIGAQAGGAAMSQDINFTINMRVGCFLLANRWDVAAILGYSFDIDSTHSFSYGLISRVHFPIRHSKISPSVGLQVMGSSFTTGTEAVYTTNTISTSAVVGVSWFVGIGSVDFDVNIGTQVSELGGYTVMPGMLKR